MLIPYAGSAKWPDYIYHLSEERRRREMAQAAARENMEILKKRESVFPAAWMNDASLMEQVRPSARSIIEDVAAANGLTVNALLSKTRQRSVVHARWEAMYWISRRTALNMSDIGRLLDLDHTTVWHGIEKYCKINNLPHPRLPKEVTHAGADKAIELSIQEGTSDE